MDYLASLEKAIEYIEQHLDEELTSEDIAQTAGYSLYHLTRIFTAVIGEPIGSYIQKRRLSTAAKKLLYSQQRIIDIALESGFGSSEAFSRAFKTIYGISPFTYRKNKTELYLGAKKMLDREALQHLSNGVTLKPTIIQIDDILVAGIRAETSIQHNILPDLWNKFHQIHNQISASPDARCFGICETDRKETYLTKDGNISFIEMVGIEVKDSTSLPKEVETKRIQGGRYAVFTHVGTVTTLPKTYDYICGSWVLFTKETLDDREDFEIYDQRFVGPDNTASQIDIYIPLKPIL